MSNIARARTLIHELISYGVTEFCVCAGARNSPLLVYLSKAKGIKVWSFFDERAASFFALGRIKSTARPVAVLCTSGTAALEFVPACAEAYYTQLPLLCVTADRPSSYRGSGAPQSIDQTQAFRGHVEKVYDLDQDADPMGILAGWSGLRPVQINICFDEPLIDAEFTSASFRPQEIKAAESANWSVEEKASLKNWISKVQKPLVILGALQLSESKEVIELLNQWQLPIYAEAPSQLRGNSKLQHLQLYSGADFISRCFEEELFDSVIRIGAVPTLRLWRDLEAKLKELPVLSISRSGFSGLSRPTLNISKLSGLTRVSQELSLDFSGHRTKEEQDALILHDRKIRLGFKDILARYPRSELSLLSKLVSAIRSKDSLYLGNSLPIREYDLVADPTRAPWRVEANRGVNGIDGQVSSFLGQAEVGRTNWALLGDLTCLYDATGPWVFSQMDSQIDLRLVVVNNSGGRIFDPMFSNPIFTNAHEVSFQKWAQWWNWSYSCHRSTEEMLEPPTERVIELAPVQSESEAVAKELSAWIKKA